MKRLSTILFFIFWICILISLSGCGEKAPTVQTKPVSKKINAQPAQPQAGVKEENGPQGLIEKKAGAPDMASPVPDAASSAESPPAKEIPASSALVQESLAMASSYDPAGRFDPFEPLFKEQAQAPEVSSTKSKRDKRIPQTPLEKVALSQLKLTAIIRAPSGNRALVEDSTGKGYVITKGTYVGLNSGRVIEIGNDSVVIEEEIENVMGAIEIQNEELKLQKPAGEL